MRKKARLDSGAAGVIRLEDGLQWIGTPTPRRGRGTLRFYDGSFSNEEFLCGVWLRRGEGNRIEVGGEMECGWNVEWNGNVCV